MKPKLLLIVCLIPVLCLPWACHRGEEHTSVAAPESGEFCYKSLSGTEYIHLSLDHDKVEGMLLNMAENQILIRNFAGKLVPEDDDHSDTRMAVSLTYADVSVDQTWRVGFEKDGLRIKYDINAREYAPYAGLPCDSLNQVFRRLENTILNYKSTGFVLPEGEPLCYEAVRPASGSYLLEFFQLWIDGGKVKGRGAGYDTGSPAWDFDFHGSLDKNTMRVTINYRETGENAHTVMETWSLDPNTKRIIIKSYPHSVLAMREYVPAENSDFLNFVHSYFKKDERIR